MDPLSATLLGLVQALTEFLPVSSSGHLVLGRHLLHIKLDDAAFEVAAHFGTLLSVVVVFRREIGQLLAATARGLRWPRRIRSSWSGDRDLRMAAAIALGCVPAGIVGLAFKDTLEAAFGSPTLVCGALMATGVILLGTALAKPGDGEVTLWRALAIGLAQAVAIVPGVSRSGATIATALFLGVERNHAARYSFLLSLPVIAGAAALQTGDLIEAPPSPDMLVALGLGAGVSFVAGVGALVLLLRLVQRGWFAHFGWYCLAVGGYGLSVGFGG